MWVRYFVPEDGDDASHPNVFRVNSNSLTLGELRQVSPTSPCCRLHPTLSLV
jgi:hypothetical protein